MTGLSYVADTIRCAGKPILKTPMRYDTDSRYIVVFLIYGPISTGRSTKIGHTHRSVALAKDIGNS